MPGNSPAAHHDYVGHGITTLSAAVHTTGGRWSAQPIAVTAPTAFSEFLMKPVELVPADTDVHPCEVPVARARLRAHPRFHRHFMRPGSSWLDLAGCRFGLLTDEQLFRRGFRTTSRSSDTASAPGVRVERRAGPFVRTMARQDSGPARHPSWLNTGTGRSVRRTAYGRERSDARAGTFHPMVGPGPQGDVASAGRTLVAPTARRAGPGCGAGKIHVDR
jgi:hypothetical protein